MKEAERDLGRLERKKNELDEALGATTDHLELARLGTELAEVSQRLHDAEERWLELAGEAEG
jgi:predicted  nucleic acid-binding Zn-ribbon protein